MLGQVSFNLSAGMAQRCFVWYELCTECNSRSTKAQEWNVAGKEIGVNYAL